LIDSGFGTSWIVGKNGVFCLVWRSEFVVLLAPPSELWCHVMLMAHWPPSEIWLHPQKFAFYLMQRCWINRALLGCGAVEDQWVHLDVDFEVK
jgi:hypothetical protein